MKTNWIKPFIYTAGGRNGKSPGWHNSRRRPSKPVVLVEYVIHPGEGHHLLGNAAQNERTQALMHFIFEE